MRRDVVICIDPATIAGWAVLSIWGSLVESGAWDMTPIEGAHRGDRWADFDSRLERLFARYPGRVAAVFIERPILYGSAARAYNTARVIFAHAASAERIAAKHGVPVAEFQPAEIKKATTGNGRASKAEVKAAVIKRFGPLSSKGKKPREDEADARGAGVAGLARYQPHELARGKLEVVW